MTGARKIPVSDIDVGKRHRKDLGDVQALADSIREIGLLHPVVVTQNNKLVVGRRRLAAFKLLGETTIPANVASTFDELSAFLKAEADENTCRKDFTPSEAVAMGAAIEKAFKPKAEAKQSASGAHGKEGGRGKKKTLRGTSPKGKQDESARTTSVAAAAAGMDRRTYEKAKAVVASGDKEAIAKMDQTGKVNGVYQNHRKQQQLSQLKSREVQPPDGLFDVIVIDPPWEMDKIERDCRPNQAASLDYPTMSIQELEKLDIPAADTCHIWLWTTHRWMWDAHALLEKWKFRTSCVFVWHKPGGFQPSGLPQFNCEFAIYARRGSPVFADTKAFNVCFSAARGDHSEKPKEFYDMVRRVTAGRRLDMFNRRKIDGFIGWGHEAEA